MKALYLFSLSFLLSCLAWADKVQLYSWSSDSTLSALVLPVKEGQTPQAAAQNYLKELSKNQDLMELFEGRIPQLVNSEFKPISDETREKRVLLMANAPKDYTKKSDRIANFKKIFSQARQESYILPLAADLGLSLTESREFFQLIANKFPLLVAMGGEDVDPRFYKSENFHAKNTVPARDDFEIRLIKSYVAQEKGFVLGICRGSQITSVALGYKLIQDLPFHKGHEVSHANDWHKVDIKFTQNNLLSRLADSQGRMYVNSLHHQSVIVKEGGPLELAAQSSDGVTEATEFKNGRGLLLQFHPEYMSNELGQKILWTVVQQKNQIMPVRCGKVF